jgi:hypothetical protein
MSSARWAKKDWDAIAAGLSSGEDSDAGDVPNVLAVQRNAHRVAELLHGAVPGLDEAQMRTLPRGANTIDYLRAGLASAARAAPPSAPRGTSAPRSAPAASAPRAAMDPA